MALRSRTRSLISYGLDNSLQTLAPQPIIGNRAPTTSDSGQLAALWVWPAQQQAYILVSNANATAVWQLIESSGGSGVFSSLTVNPGPTLLDGAVTVAAGANKITLGTTDNAASAISLTTNGGTSETIVVTNTQGTGAAAINLTATAGGIEATAAKAIALSTTDNAASAIALTTNGGTSETIVVTNTQGTGAGAISLVGTAGGISATAAKAITLSTTDNAASAIALTTNGGTSETIVITNTQGTAAGAIALKSSAGGISLATGTTNPTAGFISMAPQTGTVASGGSDTVTVNSRVISATYTGYTTANGAYQTLNISSTEILATSAIFATAYNLDTSGNHAAVHITGTYVVAGLATFSIINAGLGGSGGSLGAGDTIFINCWILN